MKSGGHFGCWTEKAINKFLVNVAGGDAVVERGHNGEKPKREDFATFAEFSKAFWKGDGYVCKDAYRPGALFWGKTPRAAAIAAGFTPLNNHY